MTSSKITQPPTPPPEPCPWLWRCHQCHILYRLATTRRCLECDHAFCLSAPTSPSKKRKRSSGPCKAEFDYVGWAAQGAWKRTMLLNNNKNNNNNNKPNTSSPTKDKGVLLASGSRRYIPAAELSAAWGDEHRALEHGSRAETAEFEAKKDALFTRKRHDCWKHCDFPSECHHALYKAQQEGRKILKMAEIQDELYENKFLTTSKGVMGDRRASIRPAVGKQVPKSRLEGNMGENSDSDSDDDSDFSDADSNSDSASEHGEEPTILPYSTSSPQTPGTDNQPLSPISSNSRQSHCSLIPIELDRAYSYETFKQSCTPPAADDSPVSPYTPSSTLSPIPIPGAEEDTENFHPLSAPPPRAKTGTCLAIPDTLFESFPRLSPGTENLDQAYSDQAWFVASSEQRSASPAAVTSPRAEAAGHTLMLLGRRRSTGAALSPVAEEPSPEMRMAGFEF